MQERVSATPLQDAPPTGKKKGRTKFPTGQLLMVSSMIFGMFFGAGNLIFPVHLGQMAGGNWSMAGLGFIISGGLLPLLAILAVVVTKSDGIYDLAKPVGSWYAGFFLVLVHLTIGPFFGTPRTAATAFEMAAKPFLKPSQYTLGMFLFTAVFFLAVYFLTTHPQKLVKYIGKYLNNFFLALLVIIFVIAFVNPMGGFNHTATAAYQSGSLVSGFLEGYNTIDAVALLALSVTFVHSVRSLGYKGKDLTSLSARAGTLALSVEVVVYFFLILLGTMSLAKFKLSANGGTALTQIVTSYLGNVGTVFLGVLVTLGVFTTAMGLVVSFAQDFHKLFPKVAYLTWLRITTLGSFMVANAGLDNIIQWSIPVLMLLYPLSLALILLSLTQKYFNKSSFVYQVTMLFTAVPSVFDMLRSCPEVITKSFLVEPLLNFYNTYVPFANLGLGWMLPTLLAYVVSMAIYKLKGAKTPSLSVNEVAPVNED